MTFNLGDRVRFMYFKGEGTVTQLFDNQTIGVTDEDGFEIPFAVNELVPLALTKAGLEASFTQTDKPQAIEIKIGISLIIENHASITHLRNFYLLNTTSFTLAYVANTQPKANENKVKLLNTGLLASQKNLLLGSLSVNDMDGWGTFHFQILYASQNIYEPISPLEASIKLKNKDLQKSHSIIEGTNIKGIKISLDAPNLPEEIDYSQIKIGDAQAQTTKKPIVQKPAEAIDLHIELLTPFYTKMTNSDMLKLQLDYFQKNLEAAIVHNIPSIIFIHGVGQGVLRNEIHKKLGKNPQVKTFKDAQKEKFGYGATEVFLKI